MSKVLGIDPGLSGALAAYDGTSLTVWDMPTWKMIVGKKNRKRIDAVELLTMLEMAVDIGCKLAVIEAVGGRPRQSASGGFVFGYTVGLIYMACISVGLAIETVPAVSWKRIMRVPVDDNGIKARYDEVFPAHRQLIMGDRGGVKTDRAEAALLAKFGLDRVLPMNLPSLDVENKLAYRRATFGD